MKLTCGAGCPVGRGIGIARAPRERATDVNRSSNAGRMRGGIKVERDGRAPESVGNQDGPSAHGKRTDHWQGLEGDCRCNQRRAPGRPQGVHVRRGTGAEGARGAHSQ